MRFNRTALSERFSLFSPGVWIILILVLISSFLVLLRPAERREGLLFWTFARSHKLMYDPEIENWNNLSASVENSVTLRLLAGDALQRRLLSGFLSDTPVPDMVEVYIQIASQAFKGPIEHIGFRDLTEQLKQDGLIKQINPPSLSPWKSRNKIFGLPHDVHPVLLAYRSDIIEAAGIDMDSITTWTEFEERLRPLMTDEDQDGYPDRYVLSLWETQPELILALMQQAGGGLFNEATEPVMASEVNIRVLSKIIQWTTGPNRIAVNAPEFDAAGNRMRLEGKVLCTIMPDWLAGVWQQDLDDLKGKVKLIPLPAWTSGGRRTSVMGGTMLGFPRRSENFDAAWSFSTNLYFSRELAHELYRVSGILTPIRSFWSDPIYHEPNAFFSQQPIGTLYIEQAPYVPTRTSSPYLGLAIQKLGDAAMTLKAYARSLDDFDEEEITHRAREVLLLAQENVVKQIQRNVFLQKEKEL